MIYIIYNHTNIILTEFKIVIFGGHFSGITKMGGSFFSSIDFFKYLPTKSMLFRVQADARDRVIYSSFKGFFLGSI